MDTILKEALDDLREQNHGIALTQNAHGDQLGILVEQGREIIKLLTPEKGDGPTLEELLGHVVSQLTELTSFARQQIKMLSALETILPADVATAVKAAGSKPTNGKAIALGTS